MDSQIRNQARAGHAAEVFLHVLRQLVGANVVPLEVVREHEYALVRLDREDLWRLYLTERSLRARAAVEAATTPSAERNFLLHAFLARAMVATASALRGRASSFISLYVAEGVAYASKLVRDSTLEGEWSALVAAFKEAQ